MQRRIIQILSTVVIAGCLLTGCGQAQMEKTQKVQSENETQPNDTYEVALVMDIGILNDKSFNQGAWEGLQEYCDTNDLSYKYYKAKEDGTQAFSAALEEAINSGAKVVVCPGYLFEVPIYLMQDQHPEVKFILIDGEPHSEDYSEYKTSENTMAVLYQEDQAGFLAGYAAVKDGNTNLGFMGGIDLPAVKRYGYGFLAGAEYAAAESGIATVNVKYTYTGSFEATKEAEALASDWYASGTEVIFGCGGSVGNSVMTAAEGTDAGKVIGVDVDQSYESITVMTSAMKMLSTSVYDAIGSVYEGNFSGGRTTVFDINNDGVGIEMDNSRFDTFDQTEYETILTKLVSGEISINSDIEVAPKDLMYSHLAIEEVSMQ